MIFSIISGDYIMSPALCSPESIEDFVEDLLKIKWTMNNNIRPRIVLEDNILFNAQERGLYPCSKVFKENIVKSSDTLIYSSQDIVTLVHSILENATELSEFSGINEIILSSEISHEVLSSCATDKRKKELTNLLTCTVFHSVHTTNNKGALLHLLPHRGKLPSNLELEVSLVQVGNDIFENIKLAYNKDIYGSYDLLLLNFGSENLLPFVKCDFSLKLALYVKALELAKDTDGNIDWDSFEIGQHMLNSLKKNQAMHGEKYSSTVIENIARVLIGKPKEEVKIFTKNTSDNQPRTHNTFTAYRTHITKGSLGLRLMFGKDSHNFIRLTNIGVKHELEILW
ncbi:MULTISPECIES: hypothetical protein [unclassified Serratia (in: enterobacteria)]|uniref:hypothetical protein n=1 Tax=unclassified Serratia (in: enterobacteria) TaxID=2647522 RepID=UPI0018AB7D7E|nr:MULTISPECIES: hypothetical protein [unclassified Serratia (in: enterobacteria)]